MLNDAYEKIKNVFEDRLAAAKDKKTERQNELAARIPEFADLDDMAKNAGIQAAKAMMSAESAYEKEKTAADLKNAIDDISKKKAALLQKAGYPPDYLEDIYVCKKCKDRGYYMENGSIRTCSCYINTLTEMLQSVSGLGEDDRYDLNDFDYDLFDDTANPERYGINCSPRENIRNICDKVKKYVDEEFALPDGKSILFTGGVGTGKTFMSKCVGYRLVHKGYSVLYLSAPELFETIMAAKYDSNDEAKKRAELIREVDCLIIDDIGTENITEAKISEFLSLLNYRFEMNFKGKKPYKMIISSNIPAEEINRFYEDSIASRIWGQFRMFKFAGNDLRLGR